MSMVHSDYNRDDDRATAAVRRISWGSILAGVAVAMVTQLVLNLLGLGIGASTLEPTADDAVSGRALGIGTVLWLAITTIVALFAGGWVAGRLAGFASRVERSLHGLITFAVVTLLTFYMLTTTLGAVLSTTTNALGQALAAAGSGAAAATDVFAYAGAAQMSQAGQPQGGGQGQGFVKSQVQQWLERQGIRVTDPKAADEVTQAGLDYLQALATGGQQAAQPQRQALVREVAENTTLEQAEVEQRVDQLAQQAEQMKDQAMQKVDQVKQQTAEAADTAADSVAGASFGAFVALVLGGAAAVLGAYFAAPSQSFVGTPIRAGAQEVRGIDGPPGL